MTWMNAMTGAALVAIYLGISALVEHFFPDDPGGGPEGQHADEAQR